MQSNTPRTEAKAVKALCHEATMISEGFSSGVCCSDDLEITSKILSDLADNIAIPETLTRLADLLNEIADAANRLGDEEHEAHTTESLLELVSENLGAKYAKMIGRG